MLLQLVIFQQLAMPASDILTTSYLMLLQLLIS